jgi:hypothetical protein
MFDDAPSGRLANRLLAAGSTPGRALVPLSERCWPAIVARRFGPAEGPVVGLAAQRQCDATATAVVGSLRSANTAATLKEMDMLTTATATATATRAWALSGDTNWT